MRIIVEKPYSFVLFEDGTRWLLTFLLGGVGEASATVILNEREVGMLRADIEGITRLVGEFTQKYELWEAREIVPSIWPPQQ